ncbi:hypothetical protein JTE90_020808 [Oedothorax gibbosus]|uniref:Uncharacterized protein n=1 Tax=Oedothorax gibbosus TaxID=931172 RepID=A0AAV6U889_9ARAC|nr:hypothetical protein JTE90_020808 [Oedothorax gibbosus]
MGSINNANWVICRLGKGDWTFGKVEKNNQKSVLVNCIPIAVSHQITAHWRNWRRTPHCNPNSLNDGRPVYLNGQPPPPPPPGVNFDSPPPLTRTD